MPTPVKTGPARPAAAAERWNISERPWGQYWISPSEVSPVDGEVLPLPMLVRIQPGVLGTENDHDPAISDHYQTKRGRIPVPLDFPVRAWGKELDHYMESMTVRTDARGKEVTHYYDVWTRYERIGAEVVTTFDAEGFADFRRRCLKLLPGATVHPTISRAAIARAQSAADAMRAGGTPLDLREAERIEAALAPKPKPEVARK